jgi:hypothetical protein
MDGKTKTDRTDRRGDDRRSKQRPFPGGDKRASERRSGAERRTAPRT